MIGIGQVLQEARIALGYSVDDMNKKTNIHIDYLTALEEERFSLLPSPFYARGFLRAYARSLKLDPQPVLDLYETKVMNRKSSQPQITHNHSLQINRRKRRNIQSTMNGEPLSQKQTLATSQTIKKKPVIQSKKDENEQSPLLSEPLAPRRDVIGEKDKRASDHFIFWTIGIAFFIIVLIGVVYFL